MKNRFWFLFVLFFSFGVLLFARGRQEGEVENRTLNDEWILCISNFDSSSLPENKTAVADLIMRKLVENIGAISFRARLTSEYAYYEETAWARVRSEKARAIASKQNERSLLVYRGYSDWMYRRSIERIDADLAKLYQELEEIDRNAPLINNQPLFRITKDNTEYRFPAAPSAGGEYRFCLNQRSDALLTGEIVEFYERFIVTLRLYTIHSRTFIWEDSVIFSHEDIESAVEEYTRNLMLVLSGSEPAVLTVRAEPEDTLVLINRAFAGIGETAQTEYPPGTVTITASAPDHGSLSFETELFSGEHKEINISLRPIEYVNVEITGSTEGRIYLGALYVGEAPLTLRLPLNQMEYIEFETSDNARAEVVFLVDGRQGVNQSLILPETVTPVTGGLDRARRNFYWSWGGTLAAGAVAWLSYYAFLNSNLAISNYYAGYGTYNQDFYDNNQRLYNTYIGSLIATGVAVALDIFFIIRYVKAANAGNTQVYQTGGN